MEPRAFKAIAAAIALMVLWNVYYYYRYKDVIEANRIEQAQKAVEQEQKAEAKPKAKLEKKEQPEPSAITDFEQLAPTMEEEAAGIAGAREIVVDTGVTRITLSTIGAVINSIQLIDFTNEDGELIELVNAEAKQRPLALEFATKEATEKINSTLFNVSTENDIKLGPGKASASLTFNFKLDNGFRIKKKLTFHHNSYRIDMDIALVHPGSSLTGSTFGLVLPGLGKDSESSYSYKGPIVLVDNKRLTDQPDEDEKETYEGEIEWAGLVSKYYCIVLLPENKKGKVTARMIGEKIYSTTIQLVSSSSGASQKIALYAGPKKVGELKDQGSQMPRMINYGWFDIIAKPIFWLLILFYGYTGNFGVAIILVTVLLKVLFFPLSNKSFKSMEKMKKIQPQMKIMQERYKDNKTKLNEELISLYRKNNVNPLSGCLPMFLQIPVFIALYKVLLESIELKGAPFMLWLTDLSLKDPYYVTPLLMGASMFLQQKLSPAATDPVQRNLMLMMPAIFTVMFLNFPSGLVVYWLVNNLLSITQQYYIARQSKAIK